MSLVARRAICVVYTGISLKGGGVFWLLLHVDMIGIHCSVNRTVRKFGIISSWDGNGTQNLIKGIFDGHVFLIPLRMR